jgi:hypothetical protein
MGEANHKPITSLLDSPNWLLPFEEVHRRLCPLIGERRLTARDMTDAFTGPVRTMRRWLSWRGRAQLRLNDPRLWAVKFELSSWSDGLYVAYRLHGKARHYPHTISFLKGYVFYAWLPDLADVWPSIFAPMLPSPVPTGTVAVIEDQETVAGTSIVEQPDAGSGDGILGFSHGEGARDLVERSGRDAITAAGTAASKPVADTAERFVDDHPRFPGEGAREYFERLLELCGNKWDRKTLQNRYYETHPKCRD